MTTDPLALLRTAETYLAATHEHATRHDNLGADYTCGGCQLRERIAAALAEASVTVDPCHPCGCPRRFNRHADGCPIRDRIVEALLTTPNDGWTYKSGHEKWDHHKHGTRPGHNYGIYCALCKGNVDVLADAVLAVLPAPANRAAVLFVSPAADGLPVAALDSATDGASALDAWARDPHGRNFLAHALVQLARDGWLRAEPDEGFEPVRDREPSEPEDPADLRRMADEAQQPDAEAPLSPYMSHPACGFHWHGRDGMDVPIRDGQPVCPRCELRTVRATIEHVRAVLETAPVVGQSALEYRGLISAALMADEAQQAEPRCTCADAGPEFAPAIHYADCPRAEQEPRP